MEKSTFTTANFADDDKYVLLTEFKVDIADDDLIVCLRQLSASLCTFLILLNFEAPREVGICNLHSNFCG